MGGVTADTETVEEAAASSLWWPRARPRGVRPVVFFPPSGAEPGIARPLVENAAGLALAVVELPGRGRRHDEPHPDHLADLVVQVADDLGAELADDAPAPVLVGHSFGGLLAYAVAGELEARGRQVGRLVAVTSQSPASWRDQRARERAGDEGTSATEQDAALDRRVERILTRGGAPEAVLAHPELAARARELVRVDAYLAAGGFGQHTLEAPVSSWVAADDEMLDAAACEGWAEVSRNAHTRIPVPGGHFFWREQPARLLTRLRLEVAELDDPYRMYA